MINTGRVKETILTFINRLGKMTIPLKKYYKEWGLNPKNWIFLGVLLAAFLLFWYPQWRVSQFGITSPKDLAEMENSYRATLSQILGGIAIGIGLYYTWRRVTIAEKELKVFQEGQITERFTRAIDQLGNPAIEIRLGGIYALERIANESEKDYWAIMEILTAYVRKNSHVNRELKGNNQTIEPISIDIQEKESTKSKVLELRKMPLDIEAIIIIIGRRKNDFSRLGSKPLNLKEVCLQMADLAGANLLGAYLTGAHLTGANLARAHLTGANLARAHLAGANLARAHLAGANLTGANLAGANLTEAHLAGAELKGANLTGTNLTGANLTGAELKGAELKGTNLTGANLTGAELKGAELKGAELKGANLKGAKNVSLDQLSQVETLYIATIDDELLIPLKEKYPDLFKSIFLKS